MSSILGATQAGASPAPSWLCLVSFAVLVAGPSTAPVCAQEPRTGGIFRPQTEDPDSPRSNDSREASVQQVEERHRLLSTRLFRAALARAPSPNERDRAVAELRDRRLNRVIEALVSSSEYQSQRRRTDPAALLEQFYQGLLDRSVDRDGTRAFLDALGRGDDQRVLLAIADSDELKRQIDQAVSEKARSADSGNDATVEEGPGPEACRQAIETRVAEQASTATTLRLRFDRLQISSTSALYETIEGRARTNERPERALEFICRVSRLSNRVIDTDLSYIDAEAAIAGDPVSSVTELRCESLSRGYRRCPIERGATVTLLELLGNAECREGWSWGKDPEAIWVDRGCRAVFQVSTSGDGSATDRLSETVEGWGVLRSLDSPTRDGALLAEVEIELSDAGQARLIFRGASDGAVAEPLVFSGDWFAESGSEGEKQEKIELTLIGLTDDESGLEEVDGNPNFDGAGSLYLRDGRIAWLQLAGRSVRREHFAVLFSAEQPTSTLDRSIHGSGSLVLPDQTISFEGATVSLREDGDAELSFRGQVALTIRGRWFSGWPGRAELVIERLGNESVTGGGTLLLLDDTPSRIEISGRSRRAEGSTGTYRLTFDTSRSAANPVRR